MSQSTFISELRIYKVKSNLKDEEKLFKTVQEKLENAGLLSNTSASTGGTQIVKEWRPLQLHTSSSARYCLFAWMKHEGTGIIEKESWFNFLKLVGLEDDFEEISSEYKTINKGIIGGFHIGGEYYLISFGRGFQYLRDIFEERFGIEMTKKLISEDGDLRRSFQKETGGSGNLLDEIMRTFKSNGKTKYKPSEDFTNATRVLKELIGKVNLSKFFHEDSNFNPRNSSRKEYRRLAFSATGTESLQLKIEKIDRQLLAEIIDRIYWYDVNVLDGLKIPELLRVPEDSTLHRLLLEELNKRVLEKGLSDFSISVSTLEELREKMIENEYVFNNAIIRDTCDQSDGIEFDSFDLIIDDAVKINLRDFPNLTSIKNLELLINYNDGSKDDSVRLTFEELIEGEILLENPHGRYFKYGEAFYEPNADLFTCVEEEFSNLFKRGIAPFKDDFLNPWESTIVKINSTVGGYRWTHNEAAFNAVHDKSDAFYVDSSHPVLHKAGYHCLDLGDSHDQSLTLNGLEICDLFIEKTSQFVHVKKCTGSKLRELFSQGAVSLRAIRDVKNNKGQDTADVLNAKIGSKKVSSTDAVYKMSVVFAIYPEKVSFQRDKYSIEDIQAFFDSSEYSKFELVRTHQELTMLGTRMYIYFIRRNELNSVTP